MPIHDWTRLDSGIFQDFHNMWLIALRNAIKHILPPGYSVMTEQRTLDYEVDVLGLQAKPPFDLGTNGNATAYTGEFGEGGVSLAVAPPRVQFTRIPATPRTESKRRWIAVRHVTGKRVVAIVEIVSPGNKSSEYKIRSFTAKTADFLAMGVHALIIDLFPPSSRDPEGIHRAIWGDAAGDFCLPSNARLTLVSYLAGQDERAFIEPVAVGQTLPDMPLFLTTDRYIQVPLESTYMAAFEEVDAEYQQLLTTSEP